MYTVWCEWDIGLTDKVFAEKWVAERHIRINLKACDIDESFEELKSNGVIGIDKKEMIFE